MLLLIIRRKFAVNMRDFSSQQFSKIHWSKCKKAECSAHGLCEREVIDRFINSVCCKKTEKLGPKDTVTEDFELEDILYVNKVSQI